MCARVPSFGPTNVASLSARLSATPCYWIDIMLQPHWQSDHIWGRLCACVCVCVRVCMWVCMGEWVTGLQVLHLCWFIAPKLQHYTHTRSFWIPAHPCGISVLAMRHSNRKAWSLSTNAWHFDHVVVVSYLKCTRMRCRLGLCARSSSQSATAVHIKQTTLLIWRIPQTRKTWERRADRCS